VTNGIPLRRPLLTSSHCKLLPNTEGVKMGATVRVNGLTLGVVRDQFLRYSFTLDPTTMHLVAGGAANRLDITFGVGDVAEDGTVRPSP
jgi:hypothetical protein